MTPDSTRRPQCHSADQAPSGIPVLRRGPGGIVGLKHEVRMRPIKAKPRKHTPDKMPTTRQSTVITTVRITPGINSNVPGSKCRSLARATRGRNLVPCGVGGRAVSAGRFGGIDGDCDPSSIIDRSACSAEDRRHDASLSVSGVSKDSCPSFVRPPDANACMALSAGEYCHRHWSMENTTKEKAYRHDIQGADLQEREFG